MIHIVTQLNYVQSCPIIDPINFHHIHMRSPSFGSPFTVLHAAQATETKAAVPEVSGRVFVQAAAHAEVGQRPRIPGAKANQRAEGMVDAVRHPSGVGGYLGDFG